MSHCIEHYYQKTLPEEQQIYQHLLDLVQVESASQMIERFRSLFIEGVDYPEPEILLILDKITTFPQAAQQFKFFLNRCCHILINRWHMQPQLHDAIGELIAVFESSPRKTKLVTSRYKAINRLREFIKQFIQSEQYLILRRLSQVMTQNNELNTQKNKPLINFIRRYPYLYEHCLITEDCPLEHQQTVRKLQSQVQKKFEIDLSKYVTYQVRRTQILQNPVVNQNRILYAVNNPTLLSDRQLNDTLKQFIGKAENNCTYHDLAQNFLQYSSQTFSFATFKQDLYEYLIPSIDWEYGKRQFNARLYTHLKNTFPEANSQKLDDFLLVRTCSQLLNFLIVESHISPQHFTFVDLISNQGTMRTTGLLLKIVLICRKIKPHLEKRFAILFNHYEGASITCMNWLIQTLEQLNIALSINFGNIDVSYFQQIC